MTEITKHNNVHDRCNDSTVLAQRNKLINNKI